MVKKKIALITVVVIILIVTGLWASGIIPKFIAKIAATSYLKNNFPKKQFEYAGIEWSSAFDGYSIKFKDEKGKEVGFIMNNKYFPIDVGQGIFAIQEEYRKEFEEENDVTTVSEKIDDLDKLKQYFEEYSSIQIFLKNDSTIKQDDELLNKLKNLQYLKDVEYLSRIDSYNELKNRFGDEIGSIDQYAVPNKIKATCYYLDDISLLDENGYFEKIKNEIKELDTDNIIDNISTSGIIEIYNSEGMEAVENYIEICNKSFKDISYEKDIDNINIKLYFPRNWNYEELPENLENNFYKYALKMYKEDENRYATIYYYRDLFSVCGTGRTSKQIDLENGYKATIGYYDRSDIWQDISFSELNKNIAIQNYGLNKEESEEFINIIKTISINQNN